MKSYFEYSFPLGRMVLAEENGKLTDAFFSDSGPCLQGERRETQLLRQARQELQQYFSGERKQFTIPLAQRGTEFQRAVWQALMEIPYGRTATYQDIAQAVGSPKACRAVGMANHRNPICILVPCHRIIGKDGNLTGYAGGLERKRILLALERKNLL